MSLDHLPSDLMKEIEGKLGLREYLMAKKVLPEGPLTERETMIKEINQITTQGHLSDLKEEFIHEVIKYNSAEKQVNALEERMNVLEKITPMDRPTINTLKRSECTLRDLRETMEISSRKMNTIQGKYIQDCLEEIRNHLEGEFEAMRMRQ